ncbi:uncharacterized protein AMSG_04903 [Thecamonas trahens ATCC 50062]|uniref:Uncharacterized protein n=1 Tax=Thecamonas trahens ATCC 50062 TaxID=461836 RepID=A0A0L0D7U5_THETB|nr:hypothetical protein AMSG_04903 [Thecamonas trahens ATCC 50062]KNC48457.1 hypothetical protein AMSG_04903 [Thecamonas trahens ATCC 50062]|eukprot:XP_013758570.1 hypothetical protein AMSG_04903 [Thecamonas trahens ATCC 50062]
MDPLGATAARTRPSPLADLDALPGYFASVHSSYAMEAAAEEAPDVLEWIRSTSQLIANDYDDSITATRSRRRRCDDDELSSGSGSSGMLGSSSCSLSFTASGSDSEEDLIDSIISSHSLVSAVGSTTAWRSTTVGRAFQASSPIKGAVPSRRGANPPQLGVGSKLRRQASSRKLGHSQANRAGNPHFTFVRTPSKIIASRRQRPALRKVQSFVSGQTEVNSAASIPNRRVQTTVYSLRNPPFEPDVEAGVALVVSTIRIPKQHSPATFGETFLGFASQELVAWLFWYVFVIYFEGRRQPEAEAKETKKARVLTHAICSKFIELVQASFFGVYRNVFLLYVGYALAETVYLLFGASFPLQPKAAAVFGPQFRNAVYRLVCSLLNGFEVSQSLIEHMQTTLFPSANFASFALESSDNRPLLKVFNTKAMFRLEESKLGLSRRTRKGIGPTVQPPPHRQTFLTQPSIASLHAGSRSSLAHSASGPLEPGALPPPELDKLMRITRKTYDFACQLAVLPDIKRAEALAKAHEQATHSADESDDDTAAGAAGPVSDVHDVTDASLRVPQRNIPFYERAQVENSHQIANEPIRREVLDVYQVSPAVTRYLDGSSPFARKTQKVPRTVPGKAQPLIFDDEGGVVTRDAPELFQLASRVMTSRNRAEQETAEAAMSLNSERIKSTRAWLNGELAKLQSLEARIAAEPDKRRKQAMLDRTNKRAQAIRASLFKSAVTSSGSMPIAQALQNDIRAYLERLDEGAAARRDIIISHTFKHGPNGELIPQDDDGPGAIAKHDSSPDSDAGAELDDSDAAQEAASGARNPTTGSMAPVEVRSIRIRRGTTQATQNLLFDLELYNDAERVALGHSIAATDIVRRADNTTNLFDSVIDEERSRLGKVDADIGGTLHLS